MMKNYDMISSGMVNIIIRYDKIMIRCYGILMRHIIYDDMMIRYEQILLYDMMIFLYDMIIL